jgi:hypothetical protein
VISIRAISAALFCGFLMTLSACAEEATPTAASTPAGSATSAPASAAAAAGGKTDKELCESAKKLGDEMTSAVVEGLKAANGDPSPDVFKKILTDMEAGMTTLIATGGDGKVTAAMKQIAAESGKAAAAADPVTASDTPAFAKAGADLTAACKAAGVVVKF